MDRLTRLAGRWAELRFEHRLGLLWLAGAVVVVGLCAGGAWDRQELVRRARASEAISAQRPAVETTRTTLRLEVERLGAELASGDRRLARPEETAGVVRELADDLAPLTNSAQEITGEPIEPFRDFALQPMTLQFRGDFAALDRVLRRIEHTSPLTMRVDRLSVQADRPAPGLAQRGPDAAGGSDEPLPPPLSISLRFSILHETDVSASEPSASPSSSSSLVRAR